MKRWLFNIVCLLTLILWMLAIGLWGRSYLAGDHFFVNRFERVPGGTYWIYYHIMVGKGAVGFNRLQQSSPATDGSFEKGVLQVSNMPFYRSKTAQYPDFKFGPSKRYWGVEVGHFAHYNDSPAPGRARAEGHLVVMPFWELLLAITIVGAPFWLYWYRRRGRKGPGFCPQCGYDLRASPERCPECGRAA